MTQAGIPTRFKGIDFRSRLEAKWAHVFDAIGWEWAYEPFDLDGWIPDFLIRCKGDADLLIDIKPIATYRTQPNELFRKMEDSSDQPFTLCVLGIEPNKNDAIGWIRMNGTWDVAIFATPDGHPEFVGVCQESGDWNDPISGEHTHGMLWPQTDLRVKAAFRSALNLVQWNKKAPRHIADVISEFRL